MEDTENEKDEKDGKGGPTPGPWTAFDLSEDRGGKAGDWDKWSIVHNGPLCYGGDNSNGADNSRANAVLISAAPELFEALVNLIHAETLSRAEAVSEGGRAMGMAQKAVLKAGGSRALAGLL
jgi:hypothetical protein